MAKHMTKIFTFFLLLINFAHAAEEGESVLRRRGLGDVAASPTNLPPVREAWPENDTRLNSVGSSNRPLSADTQFLESRDSTLTDGLHSISNVDGEELDEDSFIAEINRQEKLGSLRWKACKQIFTPAASVAIGIIGLTFGVAGYYASSTEVIANCPPPNDYVTLAANTTLQNLTNTSHMLDFTSAECLPRVINATAGTSEVLCSVLSLCVVKASGSFATLGSGLCGFGLGIMGAANYSCTNLFQIDTFQGMALEAFKKRRDELPAFKEGEKWIFTICKETIPKLL